MYKPHTIEQYKVYRFLEENFALEHFLLAPLSRFGLMLEDKTGEKIAFAFLNDCVQEIPIPAPAAPETVIAFLKQFRSLTPRPVVHDFEALTRWWLDNPNPLTYQQALGMSDDLYHHFLSHPLISEDDALRLARKGLVTESEYNDLQLWYFNGHTMSCWFGPLGVDGTGSLYGLTFDYQTASPTKTQFYLALYAVFCSGHNFTPLLHLELDTILALCPFTIQFQLYRICPWNLIPHSCKANQMVFVPPV